MQRTHDHEFPKDDPQFVFEDVLVNETNYCVGEFCDEKIVTQFEVDFQSFERNGSSVSEETAEELWDAICTRFPPDHHLSHVEWSSGVYKVSEYDSSDGYEISYDGDDIESVTCYIDGDELSFSVSFYREL